MFWATLYIARRTLYLTLYITQCYYAYNTLMFRKDKTMGATKKIKKILLDKDMTQVTLAELAGKNLLTMRNQLSRDNLTYASVEHLCDVLGCDIVFRDRETGRIYD